MGKLPMDISPPYRCHHCDNYSGPQCLAFKRNWIDEREAEVIKRIDKLEMQSGMGTKPIFKPDMVNHPPHYTHSTSEVYETIKVIEAWGLDKDFCLGNVVKYISRWNKKGDPVENLKKAQWYLNRKIENLGKNK